MPSLKLPCVFTDHAVLQHSRPVPVWGWTDPGAQISIQFRGSHQTVNADDSGKFLARLETQSPGGPFDLVFQVGDVVHVVHDVLVGEVWFCSGQSNMEWPLRDCAGADHDIPQFRQNSIRLLPVPQNAAGEPASDVATKWAHCSPERVANFSAVAAYFGKRLHEELHVPIGLIQSAWGGTTAEAWTSREALVADEQLAHLAEAKEAMGPHQDPGIWPVAADWMSPGLDVSDWKEMTVPQPWERTGLNIDGAVWFRKTVQIPDRWNGRALALSIDIADDFDITYFNGAEVGRTGPETSSWWNFSRRYTVPADRVTSGGATIAVRIFDQWGDGGLMGKPERMYLCPADDENDCIPLHGVWQYQVELALEPRFPASAVVPTSLYNGMVAPVAPFSIAGAIWYQGESNVDRSFEYRTLFPTMINCWRKAWGEDFPFLFVLLAGFHAHSIDPGDSKIAELRDAQLSTLALPNTAAASAIDLGDVEDIHPRNKRDVGARLAVAALACAYGKPVEHIGPTFQRVEIAGAEATLYFSHAEGLHFRGDTPAGFAVAGPDGIFRWANAQLDGQTVKLTSPDGSSICFLRYNWDDNPLGNFYNEAGLPMLPFRTDDRAYVTAPLAEEYGRLG